jgi:tRNA G18 (ribose-2'-O)-methylase SpoU
LEQITSPDNVGGLFRNALAFGARGVLLCPRTCDPLYRKAIRVSMGASLLVPFARCSEWPAPLKLLREAGYRVVALHPGEDASPIATATAASERLVLLLGTEGGGLSESALAQADERVRIPMAPGVDSLNVATASGIALHHFTAGAAERWRAPS